MNDKNSTLASTEQVNIFDTTKNTNLFSLSIENKPTLINRSSYSSEEISAPKASNFKATGVANSNESHSITTQAIAATVQPDLIIQNAVNPSVGSVGGSIQVSYQVKNQGAGDVGGYHYTYFYLSKDKTLSNEDTYLGSDLSRSIAAGSYSSESTTLSIGNSIATGSYYLLYQADGDKDIVESNETNNVFAKAITASKADLIIENAVNPSVGSVGGSIQVSYQVKNQGAGDVGGYHYTYFYLSKDKTLSNEDTYLGSDLSRSIAAGSYSSESTTLSIGNSIATGSYYLLYQADGDKDIVESNETNNIVAQAITTSKADLIIENAVNPSVGSVGGSIQVSYQVKNQGAGDVGGYHYTYFYLSKDKTLSNEDTYLGSDLSRSIAAGSYSSESTTLSIGNSIATGSYYLLYQADGDKDIVESNETNNVFAKAITASKADLIIENAVNPSVGSVGGSIQVSYEVKNQGAGDVGGYHYTYFYLSKDKTLSNEDTYLGSDLSRSIAAGSYSSESTTLSISNTIATGSYYLLYQADGDKDIVESNETNNIVAQAITTSKADLIIENAVNPSVGSVGGSIQVSYEVKNQGAGDVGGYHYTYFYLSKDKTLSNEDTYLGSDLSRSIAAGSYSSESTTLSIGNSIATGSYYLLYQADGDKDIVESNETNNVFAKAITASKADLIIENAVNPSVGSVGGSIQVSYEVKNQGAGDVGGYHYTYFYLSKDKTLSNEDTYLGSDLSRSIAAGSYSSESTTLSISNTIATGSYYLLYQADGDKDIVESNETNNIVAQAITTSKADLIIENAVNPSVGSVGGSIQVSYEVKNQGAGDVGGYHYTYFYLSKDKTLSNEDTYLGSDLSRSIAAGSYSSESTTLSIGNSIATGSYYLLYQADGDKDIVESNETNNVFAKAITASKADLIIENAVNPSVGSVGGSIQVSYQVKNQGAGDVGGYHYTYFYLSKDKTLSNEDTYLGSDLSRSIAAGSYSSESTTLSIGNSIATGSYYLLYQADGDKDIVESNETNNVFAKAITASKADLIIENAVNPSVGSVGGSIQVSYQVKNQGAGDVGGYHYTYFYLSKDKTLSNEDTYLGSDLSRSIAAGSYSSESTTLSIGNSIATGSYYLLYQADGDKDIVESNETNNIVAQAIAINKADLIIQNTVAPTSASAGSTIELSYQVKNQGAGNAVSSNTKFYLSTNTTLSNDDTYLGYEYVSSIVAGSYRAETSLIKIGKSIATGNYYLLYKADGDENIAESNETNNIVAKAIAITKFTGYSSIDAYGLINAAAAVAKALGQTTFADVSDLGGNDWGADLIKAPEVWAKGYTGKGIIVAVLDTGVDRNHPDLSANMWKNTKEIADNGKDDDGNGYIDDVYGWNFVNNNNNTLDVNSHGTHVSGTIAGVKNSFGVTGIAYDAKIMPVKVLGDDGYGEDIGIAEGIRYAVNNGANVINLSLGGDEPNSDLESAVKYAASKGVIVVMSAGNKSDSQPRYPGIYAKKSGLVIGAVDKYQEMVYFSNKAGSDKLAYITAPGVDVYSTVPNNQYDSYDGTSMAAPHVAGVIALMLSAKKGLTDTQVREIVTTTAANSVA